ncbi:MAG: restriction endonuclease [Gemmatimonadaceae bacterium]
MSDQRDLFDLTPREFETLCAELLRAEGWNDVEILSDARDRGIDIIASREGQSVAVEVKHGKRISPHVLRRAVDQLAASERSANQLLVITSAPVTPQQRSSIASPDGRHVDVLDQGNVLAILAKHPQIRRDQLGAVRRRRFWEFGKLSFALVAAVASILSASVDMFLRPARPPLHERIETVEQAIGSLKDLEKQLTDIKHDMVETEQATHAIKDEYAKAKELEKLTDEQFQAVSAALRAQSWRRTAMDYVVGIVLGVAASLIASVIYTKVRRRRAMADVEADA